MLEDKEKIAQYIDFKYVIKGCKLEKKMMETSNPFELYNIRKDMELIKAQMLKHLTPKKIYNNDMKFLKYLKSLKKKCILIVTHGGVIERFLGIITNTPYKQINFIDKTKPIVKENLYKYYGNLNCCIMGCLYDISEKEIKLIIPPNILHLKDFVEKEPNFYPDIKH